LKIQDDLVGFAIECQEPGDPDFDPLKNRITFDTAAEVTGARKFSSLESPFQKFRWVHFPRDPKNGSYVYRVTRMHMPSDGKLKKGLSIEQSISLDPVTYDGLVDVGFTRGFASSQAFADRFKEPAASTHSGRRSFPLMGTKRWKSRRSRGERLGTRNFIS